MKGFAAVLVAFVLALLSAPPATADPALARSVPQAGSRVAAAPSVVRLVFDQAVGGGGPYRVRVTSESGEIWDRSMAAVDGKVVTVPLRESPGSGVYEVQYQVTPPGKAALTGSYRFTVDLPGPTPPWVWVAVFVGVAGLVLAAVRLARR
ncbi:copper resistance CopC family protein [Amycolatopsis benzoatilytica]|uniref:copper resistance CopC family protein n=1 Tax=Amycolatopsis benzoatilytica TaxID=346045 RepID=UPI000376CE8D|nr:copper resistance protein CopC [Amycolatopsis benzoatilytica]